MAYQTYTTDAFVIGSEDHLTADRICRLFTREAGLVYARAVSVRKEQSKLRYGLQDFSLARVSLVRGRQGWKITGAERASNFYFKVEDRQVRAAVLRVARLIRRLVRGEEVHAALYDILTDGLRALSGCEGEGISRVEQVLTLRLLSALGYVAPKEVYQLFLSVTSIEGIHSLEWNHTVEGAIVSAIDDALVASQL